MWIAIAAWDREDRVRLGVGTRLALEGESIAAQVRQTGRPARVDSYESVEGGQAEMLRELGFRSAVGSPIRMAGRLWGAVAVSSVEDTPFPAGAEQRIADFA